MNRRPGATHRTCTLSKIHVHRLTRCRQPPRHTHSFAVLIIFFTESSLEQWCTEAPRTCTLAPERANSDPQPPLVPSCTSSWRTRTHGARPPISSHCMRDILEAVRVCHENHVIHRDIKVVNQSYFLLSHLAYNQGLMKSELRVSLALTSSLVWNTHGYLL